MEILIALILSLGINLIMFIPAFWLKTDKLTDISYALTFIILTWYSFLFNQVNMNSIILTIMITLWALRLGIFLLVRIGKVGKDKRFDDKRNSFWKFGIFWLLQGISVWIIMLPHLFFFNNESASLDTFAYLGIIIWLAGIIIETTADIQKFTFKNIAENKDRWIESGLWKYSRHPNYFGEIILWFGLYLFIFPNLSLWQSIVGLIGPIFITSLILFVSGIPLLEKSADARWGSLADYQTYKKRTSPLIPWVNKKV